MRRREDRTIRQESSGRNQIASGKLAEKTVQPTAEQIATVASSKSATDPLSVNVATQENPKATIPVKEHEEEPGRTFPLCESPPFTPAGAKSIAFPLHGK